LESRRTNFQVCTELCNRLMRCVYIYIYSLAEGKHRDCINAIDTNHNGDLSLDVRTSNFYYYSTGSQGVVHGFNPKVPEEQIKAVYDWAVKLSPNGMRVKRMKPCDNR
jgi:hypothetical protein